MLLAVQTDKEHPRLSSQGAKRKRCWIPCDHFVPIFRGGTKVPALLGEIILLLLPPKKRVNNSHFALILKGSVCHNVVESLDKICRAWPIIHGRFSCPFEACTQEKRTLRIQFKKMQQMRKSEKPE